MLELNLKLNVTSYDSVVSFLLPLITESKLKSKAATVAYKAMTKNKTNAEIDRLVVDFIESNQEKILGIINKKIEDEGIGGYLLEIKGSNI